MTANHTLDQAFNPRSLAIVGVPRSAENHPPGYTGLTFMRLLQTGGYKGRIYPINPKADEINGVKSYPNVQALPEKVDLAIVAVPVQAAIPVLEDCAAAGVRDVILATAGYTETGEADGKAMEEKVREVAMRAGLRLVGPNCLGYHVPASGMQMYEKLALQAGSVAFLSQSGGHGQTFARLASQYNFGISKLVSYGNALVMDATDFLEYLASDPQTSIICMYIEGTHNGPKLLKLVKEINRKKPVVIWKGGLSPAGSRATATHTASMAGDRQIWEAFFRQTGAIRTESIDDMMDVCMTLTHLRPFTGTRLAVFGGGGGNNVATADTCTAEGLELPPFSTETRSKLLEYISLVNQSIVNPVDSGAVYSTLGALEKTLNIVGADPNIDVMVLNFGTGFYSWFSPDKFAEYRRFIADYGRSSPSGKPLIMTIHNDGIPRDLEPFVQDMRAGGVPAYSPMYRGFRALKRVAGYYRFLAGL